MAASPRCCIIIPVYRHGELLEAVLRQTVSYGLPCFLIDDGNPLPLKETLPAEFTQSSEITVLRRPVNEGKGAACLHGAEAAYAQGFSHVLFLDADGQHAVGDVPQALALMRQSPGAMILGRPQFDRSAPWSRRVGRWVSNVWVWIETLSFDIPDSLCGFRCLPLEPLLKLAAKVSLGRRMDFDPEIVVRLFWEGVPVVHFDTQVRYPSKGVSNFKLLRDNGALFWLHTRLFFGMIWRSPFLLMRHAVPSS